MPKISRFRPLAELRHYHQLVMFGGGVVVTVMIVLAFLVNVALMARTQIEHERDRFTANTSLVMDTIRVGETYVRTLLGAMELALEQNRVVSPELVKSYVDGGCVLHAPAVLGDEALLVVGRPGCRQSDAALPRLLGLALVEQQMVAIGSMLPGRAAGTAYFYYRDGDFVGMVVRPSHVAALLDQIRRDRSALMREIRVETTIPEPPDGSEQAGVLSRRLEWLPPHVDPLSGETAVRLGGVVLDNGLPFARVEVEYPSRVLLRAVASSLSPGDGDVGQGTYLISDPAGQTMMITTTSGKEWVSVSPSGGLAVRQTGDHKGLGDLAGHLVSFSQSLGDTGWTLTYVFSWQRIVEAIAKHVLIAAYASFAILLTLWTALLLLMKRYFKPIMDQSGRVFESEQLSRTLIETAPIGLSLIARDSGASLLSSPTMFRVGDEAVAALLAQVHKGELVLPPVGRNGAQRIVKPVEIELDSPSGGTKVYSVNVSSARYLGQDILVAAFSDITEQKQLETYLQEAKQAAESANAAKSTFVAMISHEIRTPLSAIIGNLELLGDSPLNQLQRARLATIRASSAGLLNIINDVLDISRIGSGQMNLETVPFKVVPVIEQALMLFSPVAAGKGIMLVSEIDMDIAQEVIGDANRLGQVIHNLLSNAIKFTATGRVKAVARIDAGQRALVIEVLDTGIGMTKAQMSRIFEPFVQADASVASRFGGTGLGLFLCQWFVRAMSGSLAVESSMGVGSRFIVQLPLGDQVRIAAGTSGLHGRALFLATSDEWCAWAVPHLQRWGLSVLYQRRLDSLASDEVSQYDVVVLCNGGSAWTQDNEDRIVDAAKWIVDCQIDAPARPVQTGKLITVSTSSITALHDAVCMALAGGLHPAAGLATVEPDDEGTARRPALRRPVRVLAAEDNPVNAQLLADQLEKLGADARVVNSGTAALAELRSKPWDVLLTDLNMPDMRGDEVCAAARAALPELPSFVITAQATADERERCVQAGATDILLKPVSVQTLYKLLRDLNVSEPASMGEPPEEVAESIPAHLRASFAATSSKSIESLRRACGGHDEAQMRAELHSLKGMLFVTGLRALAARCEEMEEALRRGAADLREPLEELAAQLAAVLAADAESAG